MKYFIKNTKGFTSVELLVATGIMLSLIGFIYLSYFSVLKRMKSWQNKIQFERDISLMTQQLNSDMRYATDVIINDKSFHFKERQWINFNIEENRLQRDQFALMNKPEQLQNFIIETLHESKKNFLFNNSFYKQNKDSTLLLEPWFLYQLSCSQQERDVNLKSICYLRNGALYQFSQLDK